MIIDDNLKGYIVSLEPDLSEKLKEIEDYGIDNEVPIIKKDARAFLRFLLNTYKPKNVLEVGTAIGFSASFMLSLLDDDSKIDTLEKMEERIEIAENNFHKLGYENRIKIYKGDALLSLKEIYEEGKLYDFVFLDAAKAQYGSYIEYINLVLKSGGILLTDNVLQEGSVCESKFSVTRRDRTIHLRMREFIYDMMHSDMYNSTIIPIGDGMLLSVKK